MEELNLNSPALLLILTGLFAEGCFYLFYKRAKVRLKKLSGTGRVNDIEVAHNKQLLFGTAMLAIPVLIYLLK